MKYTIEILSSEEAKEKPGFGSSIKKWEQIAEALYMLSDEAATNCGLCWEMLKDHPERGSHKPHCQKYCRYGNCTTPGSHFENVKTQFCALRKAISDLLSDLYIRRAAAEEDVRP